MITNEIYQWLEKQPYWQQKLAENVLIQDSITEEEINRVYDIFKSENNLTKTKLDKEDLDFTTKRDEVDTTKNIKWKGLRNVIGVNALENDQKLEVGDQLTIIYGNNGSGKTGYTRLLNNVFVSRGDKNILPNIHKEDNEEMTAELLFEEEDGNLVELLYPKDKNHLYNKRVSVFDKVSANSMLTEESELTFVPREFEFFDMLLKGVEGVRDKLNEEISERETDNDFINYFDSDTKVKTFISNLNENTDFEKFRKEVSVTEADTKEYGESIKELKELYSLNIPNKEEEYNRLISDIESIQNEIERLNAMFSLEKLEEIEDILKERLKYVSLSSKEGLKQFEGENIENIGSPEWKHFIESAENYYDSIENHENCILCRQSLEEVTIIDKYWEYLHSSAEKELEEKNKKIKQLEEKYNKLNTKIFVRKSKIDEWLQSNDNILYEKLINIEKKFSLVKSKVMDKLKIFNVDGKVQSYTANMDMFKDIIEKIEESTKKLDSEKVENRIDSLNKIKNEYDDKLKAEKYLPEIEKFIKNSKWVYLASKKRINTRSITIFQNNLFKKYVTEEYIDIFNDECKNLKADFKVEFKQRGSKGVTLNKLTLKGNPPSNILSEGEQRSLSLANFLAETAMNKSNVCTVFDDPVSSLDYKRREIIADRLIEEAKHKQVVIFTHDLTFLLSLQTKSDEQDVEYVTHTIRKIINNAGIMTNTLPWIGLNVSRRIKQLRNNLQRIRAIYNERETPEDIQLYEDEAKSWCERLRETWERTVEEILFNNSVQRFNPSIQTSRLKKAPFTKELYEEVELGMSDCSKWVHDRAAGLGEYIPDPDELNNYLSSCENFVKENRT